LLMIPAPERFSVRFVQSLLRGHRIETPRENRYLLTFIDHFPKYVAAFPIADQSAETCAKIYATQIVARLGSGSKLITDQGTKFMSNFFNTTCKGLGISRSRTTPFYPSSNGNIERWHRSLHAGLSHYINAVLINWDEESRFYLWLKGRRSTPPRGTAPFAWSTGGKLPSPATNLLWQKWIKTTQASGYALPTCRRA
jgi:transposase InsO family protein